MGHWGEGAGVVGSKSPRNDGSRGEKGRALRGSLLQMVLKLSKSAVKFLRTRGR